MVCHRDAQLLTTVSIANTELAMLTIQIVYGHVSSSDINASQSYVRARWYMTNVMTRQPGRTERVEREHMVRVHWLCGLRTGALIGCERKVEKKLIKF